MRSLRRWLCWNAAGLGLALTALSGCQTTVPEAQLTLPTGHYLEHLPQYIPQTPPYPLPRELANQTDAGRQPTPAAPLPLIPGGGP